MKAHMYDAMRFLWKVLIIGFVVVASMFASWFTFLLWSWLTP